MAEVNRPDGLDWGKILDTALKYTRQRIFLNAGDIVGTSNMETVKLARRLGLRVRYVGPTEESSE